MDFKHEMRSFITTGCILSLVSAIPLVFAIGIGGALVSTVMGIVVSAVVGMIRNRIAQNAQHAMEGHTQIQGVLDSSQLEDNVPSAEDMIPFAKHSRIIAVVVSLAATLITGGIVAAVTNGVGINFYLGEGPSLATNSNKDTKKNSSSKTGSSGDQGLLGEDATSDEGTTETWYPAPEQEEQAQQQSTPQESTQSGANQQTDSGNTGEQPAQPTAPADSSSTSPAPSEPSSAEQSTSTQVSSQENGGTANNAQATQE